MARSFASFLRQSMTDAGRIVDADERYAATPEFEKEQLLPYHVKPGRWTGKPARRLVPRTGNSHDVSVGTRANFGIGTL
jgi:hypothetical protein